MKKSRTKSKPNVSKNKSSHYNLRNRPISSNETKNLEKMLDKMKKELIGEITKVAENIFNEHKSQIINTFIESQIKEAPPTQGINEEKKGTKSKKSKKKIKDIASNKKMMKKKIKMKITWPLFQQMLKLKRLLYLRKVKVIKKIIKKILLLQTLAKKQKLQA